MKTKQLVPQAVLAGLFVAGTATLLGLSYIRMPAASDVTGVWSGYVGDGLARLELDTNGVGYLCVNYPSNTGPLYRISHWSVSNLTVELKVQDIPTPIGQEGVARQFKYSETALEGELEIYGITQKIRLFSERTWQAQSALARERIGGLRKQKR